MLAVLLASIGAAWLVGHRRAIPQQRGAEILRDIRRRSLSAFWPEGRVERWFLGLDARGRAVAWRRTTRTARDGGYEGTIYSGHGKGMISQETWQLSGDASAGEYTGLAIGQWTIDQTLIGLKDGKVTVRRGRGAKPVSANAPDNYIPEGLGGLVLFLASRQSEQIVCHMIFNETAVVQQEVHFTPVTLVPEGRGQVRMIVQGMHRGVRYDYDADGLVKRIEDLEQNVVFSPASREDVIEHFEGVRKLGQPSAPPAALPGVGVL